MVTYDKAYSTELKDDISASGANEKYIGKTNLGQIVSKSIKHNDTFQCSSNCTLKLTCANIHVDFTDKKNINKLEQYFTNRNGGRHDDGCFRVIEENKKYVGTSNKTSIYERNDYDLIIDFKKGIGLLPSSTPTQTSNVLGTNSNISANNKLSRNNNLLTRKRTPHTKDIKKIITMFEEHELGNNPFNIFDSDKNPISFDDIFIPISDSKISNDFAIYYGQAHVQWFKKSIRLVFSKSTSIDDTGDFTSPSTFLNKDIFIEEKKQKLFSQFSRLADDYQKAIEEFKKTGDKSVFTKKLYFRIYFIGKFKRVSNYINFDTESCNIPKSLFIRKN